MSINRRKFLKGLGATLALSAVPNVRSFAYQPHFQKHKDEILVFVFLKGGCDALNFVGPLGDRFYADARLADLRVTEGEKFQLKNGLDGWEFGIHPRAAALKELYDSGDMAIIHASGLMNGTRSHFEAMDLIERGLLKSKGNAQGWMSRYLNTVDGLDQFSAVAVGCNGMPDSFLGNNQALGIDAIHEFNVEGEPYVKELLAKFYKGNNPLSRSGQHVLKTIQTLQAKHGTNEDDEDHYHAEHGAKYPEEWYVEQFSSSLKNLAKLIKMDMGVHLAMVEYDNWDHHEAQAFRFPNQLGGLSDALAAFYNDMSNYHEKLTVVVMSEFGRRLKSNRSGGTDHGYGGLSLVLGGKVKGGKMYGQWPGLANHQLDKSVDLNITTDYRAILSEVLSQRLEAAQHIPNIFPNFELKNMLGFC